MTNLEKRLELAAFLKSRRDRLSPEELGLSPGLRRRTPGLRREEVAQLAGIGVTWYTWLEQGRPIKASEQVLDAVARTLRLDAPERAHLFSLAGVVVPHQSEMQQDVLERVQPMLDKLHPYPAHLVNDRFDILAWNAALTKLHSNWEETAPENRNVIWWAYMGRENNCTLLNWEEESLWVVGLLRSAYASHVGEPAWEDFLRRMCSESPAFATQWKEHRVVHSYGRTKRFMHKDLGLITFDSTSYRPTGMCESRMVVLHHANGLDQKIQAWQ